MSYLTLLKNFGFDSDPFAQTNADEEDKLEEYFIAPPFFSSVFGDVNAPKSSIVFAPRGNGKTALKRKIELSSKRGNFLCITYNQFNTTSKSLADIDQNYHLTNLVRHVLIALLTAFQNKQNITLSKGERHLIYLFVKLYLNDIDQTDLKNSIEAIKNFSDKVKEVWNRFTGPIGLIINALLKKIGLGDAEIKKFESQGGHLGEKIDQLQILNKISKKIGYKSIYILIDKVDETSLTNGANNAYNFISSIIGDLQLLELPGFAFKFFLWDLLNDDYRKIARPDRVKAYNLNWNVEQLTNMLSERLKAFSKNRVSSLNQLIKDSGQFNLDQLISNFAQGSPRNVIRICKDIFDQQSEINSNAKRLAPESITAGFDSIARNISLERYEENLLRELTKTKRCDFTIRHIYSNVFKFTQQAGVSKIKVWEDTGAVQLLGTIQETKGAKSSNHYGIADLLLAKAVFPEISIFEFAAAKLYNCSCGNMLLRDWDINPKHTCQYCQKEVNIVTEKRKKH